MKTKANFALLAGMLFFIACGQQEVADVQPRESAAPEIGAVQFPEGVVQHVVRAAETRWQPCPPNLPSGCELIVLDGSPQAPDMFTVRFRVSGEFVMPPHTHPKDERVTVLSGKMSVAFGADATHEDAVQFGPGDYYINSRGAIHTVWADETSVIQITGIGPWEAHFAEAANK